MAARGSTKKRYEDSPSSRERLCFTYARAPNSCRRCLDSTHLYFGYDHAPMSIPLRGGGVTTLARLPENPDQLIVTTTKVVFAVRTGTGFDEQIDSVPIEGGVPMVLASVPNGVAGFGADDRSIYFVDPQGTKSVALSGGVEPE
jgi:hypothetical protein